MDKIRLLTLILLITFLCSGSHAIATDTVGEAADMIAHSIDGKSIDDLLNSKNISEVMTGMKYMETVKLLRHSYLNELKAKDISDPIALFKNAKSVGAAADILSRAINGKGIDDLLNSSDIREVLVGFNYLNRVNTLSKETIKADQGELVRIAEFNGEITKKYIWLWHNINSGITTPITVKNYDKITFSVNKKTYTFEKQGDLFNKIEKTGLSSSRNTYEDKKNPLLPAISIELKGTNEVRIKNPNNFLVTVGIRSGVRGKDFKVAANGISSVFIPNGNYKIFFIYSNQPDALFQGDDFALNNNGLEIQIVKVVGGNYGIKRVK